MTDVTFSANLGYLFTGMPLADAIRAAAGAGFDAVECHYPYDEPEADVRAALAETGLPMLALNTWPGDRAGGDFGLAALPHWQEEARAAIARAVAYAAATGTAAVHVMAGRTDAGREAETVYRANLAHACDLAAPHGIGILTEPINRRDAERYHLSHVEQGAETIRAVGRQNLRLMFDCYHTQIMQGDLIRRFEAHRDLIGHVQFAAVPDRGEPEAGEVAYPAVLAAFRDAGWTTPLGAEYKPRSGDTRDGLGWLARFRARLNGRGDEREAEG